MSVSRSRRSAPVASPNTSDPGIPLTTTTTTAEDLLAGAQRALCLGIGGGGDVVGTMVAAAAARELGTPAELGGVTWERLPIDPIPGPRRIVEINDA
ncbi:MAG: DUF1152 domain-containing protein, partial [Actinobacteria bacterium]|nr:DUF1152 domain-containing protein [Actinomycetota bacterium]